MAVKKIATRRKAVTIGTVPEVIAPAPAPAPAPAAPPKTLADEAQELLTQAAALPITTPAESAAALDIARQIRRKRIQWENHEGPVKQAAYDSYQTALQKYNDLWKPLEQAERTLKQRIGEYEILAEQQDEAARRGTALAAAKAQEESLAQLTQATETGVTTAMAQRQVEIAQARDSGDEFKARRLATLPLPPVLPAVPPPVAIPQPPPPMATKHHGFSATPKYDYVIDNPALVPDAFCTRVIDDAKIKAAIAVTGANTRIPGVRVVQRARTSLRG